MNAWIGPIQPILSKHSSNELHYEQTKNVWILLLVQCISSLWESLFVWKLWNDYMKSKIPIEYDLLRDSVISYPSMRTNVFLHFVSADFNESTNIFTIYSFFLLYCILTLSNGIATFPRNSDLSLSSSNTVTSSTSWMSMILLYYKKWKKI